MNEGPAKPPMDQNMRRPRSPSPQNLTVEALEATLGFQKWLANQEAVGCRLREGRKGRRHQGVKCELWGSGSDI